MTDVQLRPMTVDEYDVWVPRAIEEYAADNVRAGSMPAEKAQELATKQFGELLPAGVETDEHHLLVATDGGSQVGILWLKIPSAPADRTAFVYDIEVDQAMRGRGYGRAIMLAAETYSRERGATSIRLHVFGSNVVARGLYESLGYEATNISMVKSLT